MRSVAIGGRRRVVASVLVLFLLVAGMFVTRQDKAKAAVDVVRSSFQGRDAGAETGGGASLPRVSSGQTTRLSRLAGSEQP